MALGRKPIARQIAERVADDRLDATGRVDASQRVAGLGCEGDQVWAAAEELVPMDRPGMGHVVEPSTAPGLLDTRPLEEEIWSGIGDDVGVDITDVVCPAEIVAEAGGSFACTVDAADGSTGIVTVEQGGNGSVTWELTSVEPPE